MKLSHRKGFIDRESYVAQYLALAFFTIGIASTIGSDDLLAAFAAGTAVSWDGTFNIQTEDEVFSSVIDLVLNCGCFVYIGAWMPFEAFNSPDLGITVPRLIALFITILILRRIPSLLLLFRWIPEIKTWREALFSGHFGPMGVGAVFISSLALTRLPTPHDPPQNQQELLAATLQPIVSFIVLGSIIIHGLSIPFFSFGRQVHSRTLSLSATLTSRSRGEAPDWLLWIRPSASASQPGVSTMTSEVDVERATAAGATVSSTSVKEGGAIEAIEASISEDDPRASVLAGSVLPGNQPKTTVSLEINQNQSAAEKQGITTSAIYHDGEGLSDTRGVDGTDAGGPSKVPGVQSKTVRFPASQ